MITFGRWCGTDRRHLSFSRFFWAFFFSLVSDSFSFYGFLFRWLARSGWQPQIHPSRANLIKKALLFFSSSSPPSSSSSSSSSSCSSCSSSSSSSVVSFGGGEKLIRFCLVFYFFVCFVWWIFLLDSMMVSSEIRQSSVPM